MFYTFLVINKEDPLIVEEKQIRMLKKRVTSLMKENEKLQKEVLGKPLDLFITDSI